MKSNMIMFMNRAIIPAVLIAISHAQQIQLITDGGFEATSSTGRTALPVYNAGTAVAGVWYGSSTGSTVTDGLVAPLWSQKTGTYYAWAAQNASYSQLVSHTPVGSQPYTISFDWASRFAVSVADRVLTLGVYLDGTQIGASQIAGIGTLATVKQTFTHSYSSSTAMNNARFEIRWNSNVANANDLYFDNVSFTVPEPSAALLGGLGLLALLRRRRA